MIQADVRHEAATIRGHMIVSLAGFAVDGLLLYTSTASGLSAPVARLISLFWAMQATFVLNGLYVFRRLHLGAWPRQWARHMASSGSGNLVNYLLFLGLIASRWPLVSDRYVALCIGAACAWTCNYTCARLWVFGRALRRAPSPP